MTKPDKVERQRLKMLRDIKRWALSRAGMDDPETRPKLEVVAAKADESIERIKKKGRPGEGAA